MSMLARYRKSGGFDQLLSLIETSEENKKEKLLKLIEVESPETARFIREKMLTAKEIFSWDPLEIKLIYTEIPLKVLAYACHGLDNSVRDLIISFLSRVPKQEFQQIYDNDKPNPGQISAACAQIVKKTRELHSRGIIDIYRINPNLITKTIKVA